MIQHKKSIHKSFLLLLILVLMSTSFLPPLIYSSQAGSRVLALDNWETPDQVVAEEVEGQGQAAAGGEVPEDTTSTPEEELDQLPDPNQVGDPALDPDSTTTTTEAESSQVEPTEPSPDQTSQPEEPTASSSQSTDQATGQPNPNESTGEPGPNPTLAPSQPTGNQGSGDQPSNPNVGEGEITPYSSTPAETGRSNILLNPRPEELPADLPYLPLVFAAGPQGSFRGDSLGDTCVLYALPGTSWAEILSVLPPARQLNDPSFIQAVEQPAFVTADSLAAGPYRQVGWEPAPPEGLLAADFSQSQPFTAVWTRDYDQIAYQIRLRTSLATEGMDLARLLDQDPADPSLPYLPLTTSDSEGLPTSDPYLAESGFYLPLDPLAYYPGKQENIYYTELRSAFTAPLYESVLEEEGLSYRLRPFGLALAEDPTFTAGARIRYDLNLAALSSPLIYAQVLTEKDYQATLEALSLRENIRQGLLAQPEPSPEELLVAASEAGGEPDALAGLRYLESLEAEKALDLRSRSDLYPHFFAGLQPVESPAAYTATGALVYDYLLKLQLRQVASSQVTVRLQAAPALDSTYAPAPADAPANAPADAPAVAPALGLEEEIVLPLSFESVSRTQILPTEPGLQFMASGEPYQGQPVFRLEDLDFKEDTARGLYRLDLSMTDETLSLADRYGDPDASLKRKHDPFYPENPWEREAQILRAQNLMASQSDLPRLLLAGQSSGILELPLPKAAPTAEGVAEPEAGLEAGLEAAADTTVEAESASQLAATESQPQRLLYCFTISYDPIAGALVEFTPLQGQLTDPSLTPESEGHNPEGNAPGATDSTASDKLILNPQTPEPPEGFVRLSFRSGAEFVPFPLASLRLPATQVSEQSVIVYDVQADLTWAEALAEGLLIPEISPLEGSFLRPLQEEHPTWMSLPEADGHSQALIQGGLLGLPLPDSYDQRTLAEILAQAKDELARANHERQNRLLEEPEIYQDYPEFPQLADRNLSFYVQYEPVIEGAESPVTPPPPSFAARAATSGTVEVADKREKAVQILQQKYPYLANKPYTYTSGLRYAAVRHMSNETVGENGITLMGVNGVNYTYGAGREIIKLNEYSWFSSFSYYGYGGQNGKILYFFEDPAFEEAIEAIYLNFSKFGVLSHQNTWRPFTRLDNGGWFAPTRYHCTALGSYYVSDVMIILKDGASLQNLTTAKPVALDHLYLTADDRIDLKSVQNTTLDNIQSGDQDSVVNPTQLPVLDMESAWGWPKGGVFSNNVYYLTADQLKSQAITQATRPELTSIFKAPSDIYAPTAEPEANAYLNNGVIVSDHLISFTEPFETTDYFWEIIIKETIPPEILPFVDTRSMCLVGQDKNVVFYQYSDKGSATGFDSTEVAELSSKRLDKQPLGEKSEADYIYTDHHGAFSTARGNLKRIFGIAGGATRSYHTCYRLKSNEDLIDMVLTPMGKASPEVANIQKRVALSLGWTTGDNANYATYADYISTKFDQISGDSAEADKGKIIMEEFKNFLHDKTGDTPASGTTSEETVNTNRPIWKSWQESYWPSFSPGAMVTGEHRGTHHAYIKESYATGYIQTLYSDEDSDMDGLPDALELKIGTDPLNPDTDWDGVPDGQEYLYDLTSPLDVREFKPPKPMLDHGAILNHANNTSTGFQVKEDKDGNLWFPAGVPSNKHKYMLFGKAPKVHYQDPLWLYGERSSDGKDYINDHTKYNLGHSGWNWSEEWQKSPTPPRVFGGKDLKPYLYPVYKGGDDNYYLGYHPLASDYVVKLEVSRYLGEDSSGEPLYAAWVDWNPGSHLEQPGGVHDNDHNTYYHIIDKKDGFYEINPNGKADGDIRTSGWTIIGNILKPLSEGAGGFIPGSMIPSNPNDKIGRTPENALKGEFTFELYVDFQDVPDNPDNAETRSDLKEKDKLRLVAYPPLWRTILLSNAIYGWGNTGLLSALVKNPYHGEYNWPMRFPGKPGENKFTRNYFVGGSYLGFKEDGSYEYVDPDHDANLGGFAKIKRNNIEYKYKPNNNFDYESREDQAPWQKNEVDVYSTTATEIQDRDTSNSPLPLIGYQWAMRHKVIGETFYIGDPPQDFIKIVPNAFGEYAREDANNPGQMVKIIPFAEGVTEAGKQPFKVIEEAMQTTGLDAPIVTPKSEDYDGKPLNLVMEGDQPYVFYSFDFEGKFFFTAADAKDENGVIQNLQAIADDIGFAGTIDTIYVNYVKRVDKFQDVEYSPENGQLFEHNFAEGTEWTSYLHTSADLPGERFIYDPSGDPEDPKRLMYSLFTDPNNDNQLTLDIHGTRKPDANGAIVQSPRLNLVIESTGGASGGEQIFAPIQVYFYPKVIEQPPVDFTSEEYIFLTFHANGAIPPHHPQIAEAGKRYRGALNSRKNPTEVKNQAAITYAIHKDYKWSTFVNNYLPNIAPHTEIGYNSLAANPTGTDFLESSGSLWERNWNFYPNPEDKYLNGTGLEVASIRAWNKLLGNAPDESILTLRDIYDTDNPLTKHQLAETDENGNPIFTFQKYGSLDEAGKKVLPTLYAQYSSPPPTGLDFNASGEVLALTLSALTLLWALVFHRKR